MRAERERTAKKYRSEGEEAHRSVPEQEVRRVQGVDRGQDLRAGNQAPHSQNRQQAGQIQPAALAPRPVEHLGEQDVFGAADRVGLHAEQRESRDLQPADLVLAVENMLPEGRKRRQYYLGIDFIREGTKLPKLEIWQEELLEHYPDLADRALVPDQEINLLPEDAIFGFRYADTPARPARALALIALVVAGAPGRALAHPHVFIDAGASFVKEVKALGGSVPIYMLSSVGDQLNLSTDYSNLGLTGVFMAERAPASNTDFERVVVDVSRAALGRELGRSLGEPVESVLHCRLGARIGGDLRRRRRRAACRVMASANASSFEDSPPGYRSRHSWNSRKDEPDHSRSSGRPRACHSSAASRAERPGSPPSSRACCRPPAPRSAW